MSKKKSSYFKPNASQREATLTATIRSELEKQHSAGIAQGAYAMCQVVLSQAKDDSKSAEERLQNIVEFCSICIDPKKAAEKRKISNA